jgi:hypothetical protein
MLPKISPRIRRWWLGTRMPLIVFTAIALAFFAGHQLAVERLQPLRPQVEFSNTTDTIEASGAWKTTDSNVPNATGIFCWFPVNTCQLVVAELVPEGNRSRFKIVEKSLDIIQLSDATLTAASTSTDPCKVETLRVDRKAQSATLSVGPSHATGCSGVGTFTATLGG